MSKDTEILDDVIELEALEQQITPPKLYTIKVYNDDYTPADFVVDVVKKHLNMGSFAAWHFIYEVHKKGHGTIGQFPKDIAESKSLAINNEAQSNGYPLKTDYIEA